MKHSQFTVDSLQVTKDGELIKERPYPFAIRLAAKLFSYIFHPLFIPSIIAAYLLFIHPYAFAGFDHRLKLMRLYSIIVSTALLPGFAVFLLWRLKFIQSIFVHTQKERIIPYAICIVFYFWIWYVHKNLPDSPLAIKQFLLGAFLAVCGAWLANTHWKVSMHTTAVGGLATFLVTQAFFQDGYTSGIYLSIAMLITGIVCSSRLVISKHTTFEIYLGLFIGCAAQLLAVWFS